MDALQEARAFAHSGRFDEAILCATAANHRLRDASLERTLAVWRSQAFSALDRSHRRADWPAVYEDVFPGAQSLPDLPAAQLDLAHLGAAITCHGGLIVRGLLAPTEARYFAAGIDKAMAARDAGPGQIVGADSCWHCEFPLPRESNLGYSRPWLQSHGGLLLADSPRLLFDLIEMLKQKGIDRLMGDYLAERPVISVGKSTLRRVRAAASADWHQDGAFLGRDTRTVDLWIALSDCGIDAPGLELIPRRLSGIVHTGTNGAEFDWTVGHETALQTAAGRPIVSPHFRPGDAVLFDQLMLHRTGMRASMTRERWAIETWFFAPSTCPMDQVPLVIL